MSSLKIRVLGAGPVVKAIIEDFQRFYDVNDVSPQYPVRDRVKKGLVRQYVEIELAGEKKKGKRI